MPKLLILQGGLYTIIAALTPVATSLISDSPLTVRSVLALVVISLIAGATALKAFLSTTFSESSASRPDKPVVEPPPPVRLVNNSGRALESMAEELRVFYRANPKASEPDLALLIQKNFGTRLLHDVCLPNNIPYGVCLIIATAVAKGEQSLSEILDGHLPQNAGSYGWSENKS